MEHSFKKLSDALEKAIIKRCDETISYDDNIPDMVMCLISLNEYMDKNPKFNSK